MSDNPRFKHGDALSLNQKRLTAHKLLKRLETPNLGSLILTWLKGVCRLRTPLGDEAATHNVSVRLDICCPSSHF